MSLGSLQVTLSSLSTTTVHPSLSISVSLGPQSSATSKLRHSNGSDFDPETLTFNFDSDVHSPVLLLEVKSGRSIIETFTVDALSLNGSSKSLSGAQASLVLTTKFDLEHGMDLSKTSYLFPLSYLMVLLLWFAPQHYELNYQVNLLLTTASLIYLGSHLSLALRCEDGDEHGTESEGEVMSASDAYRFPFVGSAALFSLYTAFKYLDPEWVNFLISFYFTFAGALAVASSFGPVVGSVLPSGVKKSYRYTIPHPLPPSVLDSPYTVEVSVHGVLSFVVGSIVGYFYFTSKHWTLNNVLGMCFCIQGISMFSIGSFKTASILLVGLFFYDVFWVFGTPVMVTVAKKLDGPIKLLFPRSLERNEEGKLNLSLLGLGDIVIPGFLLSFMLRFDAYLARVPPTYNPSLSFPKPYFNTVLLCYVSGLALTLQMMTRFNAAQPALLYLVPFCLGGCMVTAAVRGEVKELWEFSEEKGEEGENDKVEETRRLTPVKSARKAKKTE